MTQPTNRRQLAPVVLCCTECGHIFRPDLLAQLSSTGCEECGGWTWIAQTDLPPLPPLPHPRDPHAGDDRSDTQTTSLGGTR
jgi:hypothetical protein